MVKLRVPKDERNHNVNFGCVIEDLQDCERYISELEQMVRNLLREGTCLLNAAGDEGMRGETAALDWCCTAEDALELLENSHAQT